MHAADQLGPGAVPGDLGYVEGRGVAGQDGVGGHLAFHLGEHLLLEGQVLGYGLQHELHPVQGLGPVGVGGDQAGNGLGLLRGDKALGQVHVQYFFYALHADGQLVRAHVEQAGFQTGPGKAYAEASAHGASANNSYFLDIIYIHGYSPHDDSW